MDMDVEWFKEAFEHMLEGIIMMDSSRRITYMNPLAHQMTGWELAEPVPFCSYCQIRYVKEGEERCVLANPDPLPAFQATLPTYKGLNESFEMSLSPFFIKDQKYWVLVLRNPKWTTEKQQLKIKQLLIHDTMSAQEAERIRIARELHDHIGQTVYSVFLGLQSMKSYIQDEDFTSHLKKMEAGLGKTLEDIKRLSKELHPSTLEHLGLETTLRRFAKDWSLLYGVECTADIDLEGTHLSKEHSLHIFRIIQEAVLNAVRHGDPKLVTIQLKVKENQVQFEIFDNGIGFDVKNKQSKGLGRYHMIERIHMIGGEIQWISEKGKYTIVEGYVPLGEIENERTDY